MRRSRHRVAAVLAAIDDILADEQPDRLVILGDTDSGLSAYVAARRGIPVFHLEAGNRAYDDHGCPRRSTGGSSTTSARC